MVVSVSRRIVSILHMKVRVRVRHNPTKSDYACNNKILLLSTTKSPMNLLNDMPKPMSGTFSISDISTKITSQTRGLFKFDMLHNSNLWVHICKNENISILSIDLLPKGLKD